MIDNHASQPDDLDPSKTACSKIIITHGNRIDLFQTNPSEIDRGSLAPILGRED